MSKKVDFSEEDLLNLCTYDCELFDDASDDLSEGDSKRNLNARKQIEERLEQKRLLMEISDLFDSH